MRTSARISLIVFTILLSACNTTKMQTPEAKQTLRVMTHDSFAISANLVAQFEAKNNVKLEFIKGGDAGTMLNKALLTKANPLADVLYGVDNTFLSRELENDLLEPYSSPALADIPVELHMDASNRALPVDYGDVCINYDKAYFTRARLALPQSLADLLKPEYAGLLVVENPAISSPGLAFMLATISTYGEEGYLDYWRALNANGLVVVNDWEMAYYTNFSASSGNGPQPMVVSYGTSPAAEVVYASTPMDEAPTASLVGDGMCYRQVEFIGIIKGTSNRSLAEKFVDFMLSVPVQEDIPLQMFVFPANKKAALPDVFLQNIQVPARPASLDPDEVHLNREKWLQEWTEVILR
ncbi:MAG: thiamine ABC transporter substrate-binding protein [Anaerolinea sp.]|nr:thiamine ABC transporter substrate-binding protein [Anaerolinea sp.]